jgi:D-alanyl-lipoteichoic acid acyltransferase DltB (MBOAT superfamily)
MLFNSFSFLLLFLPASLLGFFLLAQKKQAYATAWLALVSLFFYGWWSMQYIPLLLGSILFNYGMGRLIGHAVAPLRFRWLSFGVIANLGLLAYFKYADFFVASTNAITGSAWPLLHIVLPIGISFFTFTQIAFLVDTYQGKIAEYRFLPYVLFVTYFPHLIAGPVLHHKEMMPQFDEKKTYKISAENFSVGISIFTLGLAKKVLLADNLAPHAVFVFDTLEHPSMLVAWGGVLAYTFQLYFDFSGYSDMAIGLSRLFGIKLPLNFNSPYQAVNIAQFWRRWHMTLSRFLRDYLYIPLGGNRQGAARRYTNLMITMVLGGLWHGAAWNFVIWGTLHGIYLMLHQAWSALATKLSLPVQGRCWRVIGIAITFVAVCFSWVFFRANSVEVALHMVKGMLGGYGIGLPEAIGYRLGSARPLLERWGVEFYLGGGERFVQTYAWVMLAACLSFFMPNTQQIMAYDAIAFDGAAVQGSRYLRWRPQALWAIWIAVLMVASLLSLNRPSEFLYFQF